MQKSIETGCTTEGRTVRPEMVAAYIVVLLRLVLAPWLLPLLPLLGFSLLLLLRSSMTSILMFILLGLLGKLSLSLDLLVEGLLLAGPLLTTLQLLAGLDSTGIAGSVSPWAAGRQKGLHVAHEKRQALCQRWTLSLRMPGSTLPCRQHCRSEERRMKWTLLLRQRFLRPLLSAAIVSLPRYLAFEGILPLLQHQLSKMRA